MASETLGWIFLALGGALLVVLLVMAALDSVDHVARRRRRGRGGVPAVPVPCPSCLPELGIHRPWCPRLGTTGQFGPPWQPADPALPRGWEPLPLHAPPRTLGGAP